MDNSDVKKFKTKVFIASCISILICFILMMFSTDVNISHEAEVVIALYMFLFGGGGVFFLLMSLT